MVARLSRDADCHGLRSEPETPGMPLPGKRFACDVRRSQAIRHIVLVEADIPIVFVPPVAASSLAPAGDEGSLERIDRPPVLEPLHDPVAAPGAALAATAPGRAVFRGRMPIPH